MSYRIFRPGHNCWRIERAKRAAFLIDAAAYFRAFRDATLRARRQVQILAWDIYSGLELVREGENKGMPVRLKDLLNAVAAKAEGFEVYVLDWDFTLLYARDREWLPVFKLDWRTHPRVHFRLDDRHQVGASHHQKIVAMDDTLAFAGGLDLTRSRWDTPEHRPGDPRRCEDSSKPCPPHHYIQIMVAGDAASALGELARRRWQRACGERLSPRSRRRWRTCGRRRSSPIWRTSMSP